MYGLMDGKDVLQGQEDRYLTKQTYIILLAFIGIQMIVYASMLCNKSTLKLPYSGIYLRGSNFCEFCEESRTSKF